MLIKWPLCIDLGHFGGKGRREAGEDKNGFRDNGQGGRRNRGGVKIPWCTGADGRGAFSCLRWINYTMEGQECGARGVG